MAEQFTNLAHSTLVNDIIAAEASLVVADGSKFPTTGDFRVCIDSEIIIVGARTGNTLSSLTRGAEGTTAVGHTSGTDIAHVLTAASMTKIPVDHSVLTNVTGDQHHAQAHSISGADHTGSLSHASLTGVTGDQHHAESHTLTSHSTRAHSELTSVGADDHHAKSHAHTVGDGSGTVQHSDLGGVAADQHHAQAHTLTSHSTRAHSELTSIGIDDHHTKAHTVDEHTTAVTVQDEGIEQGDVHTLNIVGSGISATVAAGVATIDATAASGTGYSEVQNEGSALTARGKLNFKGTPVTAADNVGSAATDVTVDDYAVSAGIASVSIVSDGGAAASIARGDHVHAHEATHITHDAAWNAKGDIIAGTGADTAGILSVGVSGQVLRANISETTGLEWASAGNIQDEFVLGQSETVVDTGTVHNLSLSVDIAVVRWLGDGVNDVTYTGIQSGQEHGSTLVFLNSADVAGVDATLSHQDAGSTAANRFILPNASNLTLERGEGVVLWYDANQSRWRAVARSAAPASVDYLVGTASGNLSSEIVVGTSPGGELGGTWASPTVDATHSGSSHSGVVSTHEAAADPHTGYLKESDVAAKGDLYVGTADNTVGILTVGANDTIPMADSAETTGIRWQAPAGTAEIADIAETEAAGTSDTWARGDHVHSGNIYRLESADHTHASSGAQGGTVSHDVLTGVSADDHHNQSHGVSDHTNRTKSLYIHAGMVNPDTGAAAWAGTAPDRYLRINLVDASTTGFGFTFFVPEDWDNGQMSIINYVTGLGNFGVNDTFRLDVTALEVADSASMTGAGTTTAADHTPGTNYVAHDLYETASQSLLTPSSNSKMVRVYIRRLGGHANDDYANTVLWVGCRILYTADS